MALAGGPDLVEAERAAREVLMLGDGPYWSDILDGSAGARESALGRLAEHNAEVKRRVGADRLFVYDVEDGWEPLCTLLELPVPDVPFPHLNAGAAVARLPRRATAPRRSGPLGVGRQLRIGGLALSDPPRSYSQREILGLLGMSGDPFAEGVFDRCAVQRRQLELGEAALAEPLQARTRLVEEGVMSHAIAAVDKLGIEPAEIGTVVTATLTSLGVPTLAHRLADHYDMAPDVDKYHLIGVGCASAVPLVRVAEQAIRSDPERKALIVAPESMSGLLTRATGDDPRAKIVGAAIFGDGCAASVLSQGDESAGPAVVASTVHQIGGTLGAVRMEVSADDSYLHLDRDLPDVATAELLPLVDAFLEPLGLTRFAIDHWIVHPGGRRIIECVQGALALSDEQVEDSYAVLRDHGNMGTPTIFYVLDKTLKRSPARGDRGLVITVGPGITVGLMLLIF
jgi:predicted naringenin-chalcone synthase